MKSEGKDTLQTYFDSKTNQYVIPFFQRAYVWTEENWSNFWDSIEEELRKYQAREKSEHFIGTIITRDTSDSWKTIPKSIELVDGQQRITTTSLVLRAIAARATRPELRDFTMGLLVLKDKKGKLHHRVKHSRVDREYFGGLMDGKDFSDVPEGTSNLLDGYRYFYHQLEGFDDDELDTLSEVVLGNLPVISIELDERDDEQEIFDTINSLGVRLTIGELLKNYLFREQALRDLYDDTWLATFESDEETINFWNATKTAGRVKRTNLELLLYAFLIIETGREVRLEKLYRGYKAYLENLDLDGRKRFLQKLTEYATEYANFPTVEELDQLTVADREKRLFHVVEYLEITTVYPLLLYIYQRTQAGGERDRCLALLESYLVRRTITRLSNKNYNRLFISWIAELRSGGDFTFAALSRLIEEADNDTSRMPTDEEVRLGFRESFLYNKNAREILFFIALHQLDNGRYHDTQRNLLPVTAYSVEHILPKKWGAHWNRPKLSEADTDARNWWLKRLGNLTLITGNMNSKLRHASWKKKRRALAEFSQLVLTTDYLELEEWNEDRIKARAVNLASAGLEIWPNA